ncbi:hypothetical protein DM01DRAFT_1337690 [Hesseltinella vesiculosa]|uniref:Xylanolytic transcriptional activator regulatory domain-containing protein n=1 Tax=Hesseltinella vesiculosa TaxID=101127 RepID=A0A1X2GCC4_9FUNG|nr:hypothetical protein DM01DRAFT_1337690 [Hesseltinella vesiculosa]
MSEEERAATLELKNQQHELEALQITFYEIEAWIEKTSPILNRMTSELCKASEQFEKRRSLQPPQPQPVATTSNNHLRLPPEPIPTPSYSSPSILNNTQHDLHCPMKWSMSFQPNNSMRLETNIKSVDELVEAVQQIRLLTNDDPALPDHPFPSHPSSYFSRRRSRHTQADDEEDDDDLLYDDAGALLSPVSNITMATAWTNMEYWREAIRRRPRICLEKYKHHDMNLSCLTKDVSPNVMHYICHLYWDCLHPKFSSDWMTFWDRCDEPQRNQLCIDSGLAIVFMHGTRHHKDICANAHDIAFFYYDRARENLMDYFDTPHCATLETLLNLSMFCILCKQHSQSRIYIGLAIRMMLEMGMHRRSSLPADNLILRKKYLKFFMVLYYNDIQSSLYSGEPTQVNDNECDIDFYEVITLNTNLQQSKLTAYDDKVLEKEVFFVHLMALSKIGKQTVDLINDYQCQPHPLPHIVKDDLPYRWAKRIQALEIELAQWYNRLPDYYRVSMEPKSPPAKFHQHPSHGEYPHTPMCAGDLRMQSGLILMLQYQTQWILLHKTFYNSATSRRCSPVSTMASAFPLTPTATHGPGLSSPPLSSPISPPTFANNHSSSSSTASGSPCWQPTQRQQWHRQCNSRSEIVCLDAANRIVVLAETITEQFGWCVCQQFINCIYHASTIFCRHIIDHNNNAPAAKTPTRRHADAMLQRVVRVLSFSTMHYHGLPDDLCASLKDLLQQHGVLPTEDQAPPQPMDHEMDGLLTVSLEDALMEPPITANIEPPTDYFSSRPPPPISTAAVDRPTDASLYMPSSPVLSPSSSPTNHGSTTSPDASGSPFQPPPPNTLFEFIDTLPNSPHMYQYCLAQPRIRSSSKYRSLMAGESPTEAMLSIKMKDPVVDDSLAMEKNSALSASWRHKFSSPYVAAGNQRII